MKVQLEEVSPIRKKLLIEVSHEEYLQELERAYVRLNEKVSIKGFRKGKAPRATLEAFYKEKTESDVISELVQQGYLWSIKDQKLDPVAPPRITDLKKEENAPLQFTAEIEVRPVVEVENYKKVPIQKTKNEIQEDEINQELKKLQESQAQILPVEEDRAIVSGDIAVIDFKGTIDGKEFPGGTAQAVFVDVGRGGFLPEFETGLVGMKKGETKIIPIEFPADYAKADLAGKKASFEVSLQDIKIKQLPELDDEFAKDLGEFNSLQEVKDKIQERLKLQKEQNLRWDTIQKILDHLIEKNPFEIPEMMVEQEINHLFENAKLRLQEQGMTPEQAGINPATFREGNLDLARRRVRSFFIFDSIGKKEAIKVNPEDLSDRISKIAASVQQPIEAVEQYYRQHQMLHAIQNQILEEKIIDFLIQEADLTEAN